MGGILRKRYYYGRGLASYKRDHPGSACRPQEGGDGVTRRNWRHLIKKPVVTTGVVFMRGVEAAAYGLGALVEAKGGKNEA